jgi:HD-GYP domain-containing protein (c-di-GMP phosphodiesterase class II)
MPVHTSEVELALSGGAGCASSSARAGFLPIPLRRVSASTLKSIAVYLRTRPGEAHDLAVGEFLLYRSPDVTFTAEDRERLIENGRQFIYIATADQSLFQRQAECDLQEVMDDPARDFAERSAMVYDTSVELMNEVLTDPDLLKHSAQIENVSRAVTTLVLNDAQAFRHLFAASHHDFYTATHMVNVATWMVPVSHALGYRDHGELRSICQAGLLHDLGKVRVPAAVLNKGEQLSDADWALIRRHPALGGARLVAQGKPDPLVVTVARQHHERLDGSGYPDGLSGDQIHRVSRICAVVDSFDAMTALRPYKQHSMCISDAIIAIKAETPAKYDPEVVEAWLALLNQVDDRELLLGPDAKADTPEMSPQERRRNKRYSCDCHAKIQIVQPDTSAESPVAPEVSALVHSVSRFGMGMLTPKEIEIGQHVRIRYHDARGAERILYGEAVRCRAYEDGWFNIGVELVRRG